MQVVEVKESNKQLESELKKSYIVVSTSLNSRNKVPQNQHTALSKISGARIVVDYHFLATSAPI